MNLKIVVDGQRVGYISMVRNNPYSDQMQLYNTYIMSIYSLWV